MITPVGLAVGFDDGIGVRTEDGEVGTEDGAKDDGGAKVGVNDGAKDGAVIGMDEGTDDGTEDDTKLGSLVATTPEISDKC